MLDDGERVPFSTQKKYCLTINIESAMIASKRVILRRPLMITIKKSHIDYSYADITNIVPNKLPLRSTIMLNIKMAANDLVIKDIPNDMAKQAFRLIREGIDQSRRITNAA